MFNKIKKENSFKFPHLIINLSTFSLISLQTNLNSNKLNENIVLVRALNFKNVNTQNEDVKFNIKFIQSFNGFVKKKIDDSFINSLIFLLIVLIY